MFDFVKKWFQPEASGATARERLRLVLLSDHLALAPDVVESLKIDLIAVISKYVDVDAANCDVTFEQQDRQVAMLANIPIVGMKRPPSRTAPVTPAPEPPPPMMGPAPASAALIDADVAEPTITEGAPEASATPSDETPAPKAKPRRRRRRSGTARPATSPG